MIFINLDSFQLPSGENEKVKEREKKKGEMREPMDIRFSRRGYGGFSVLVEGQKVKLESQDSEKKSK